MVLYIYAVTASLLIEDELDLGRQFIQIVISRRGFGPRLTGRNRGGDRNRLDSDGLGRRERWQQRELDWQGNPFGLP